MNDRFRVVPAGDSTLVVEFEERIDPVVNARAIRVAEALVAAPIAGVRDVVPAYRSVAVFFDPLRTDLAVLLDRLEREASQPGDPIVEARPAVEVPVCYDDELGPDLRAVASFAKMSAEQVVALHTRTTYRVFMLGFLPGFAYMGVVDPRIAAPRHAVPRVRVPRGSVAIAGAQTGIYPIDSPGGWQLIGRTPIQPFVASRPVPFLFKAGDAVQFVAMSRDAYERIGSEPSSLADSR